MQLYTRGMVESGFRGMEDDIVNPNEYGVDWEGPTVNNNDDNIVIVNEPRNILTDEQYQYLQSEIDPLAGSR
jgi:hypothetical protein